MQKAILCVLVLIALIMAPWLLGPLLAAVAAYWAVLVVAVVVGVIIAVAIALKGDKGSEYKAPPSCSRSMGGKIAEANARYRQQMATEERAKAHS